MNIPIRAPRLTDQPRLAWDLRPLTVSPRAGNPGSAPRGWATVNLGDALVLVLCFPAAGLLLFSLAAIEKRLSGPPPQRTHPADGTGHSDHEPADHGPKDAASPDLRNAA